MLVARILGAVVLVDGWTNPEFFVAIIIFAAIVAITLATLRYFSIAIPPLVVWIFWIVVAAALAILAIRFIASL